MFKYHYEYVLLCITMCCYLVCITVCYYSTCDHVLILIPATWYVLPCITTRYYAHRHIYGSVTCFSHPCLDAAAWRTTPRCITTTTSRTGSSRRTLPRTDPLRSSWTSLSTSFPNAPYTFRWWGQGEALDGEGKRRGRELLVLPLRPEMWFFVLLLKPLRPWALHFRWDGKMVGIGSDDKIHLHNNTSKRVVSLLLPVEDCRPVLVTKVVEFLQVFCAPNGPTALNGLLLRAFFFSSQGTSVVPRWL